MEALVLLLLLPRAVAPRPLLLMVLLLLQLPAPRLVLKRARLLLQLHSARPRAVASLLRMMPPLPQALEEHK